MPDIGFVCIDWGGTLMSEDGPADIPMADWPSVTVINGARELLETLARIRTVCVATNATVSRRAEIERALIRGGLRRFIEHVFCYTEIGAKKSSPDFWQVVTTRLQCTPAEIAMLGDSLEEDVLGPSRAGIFSVLYNPDGAAVPPGVRMVRRLEDFATLIERR